MGLKGCDGMYAAMGTVVGCNFLVEVKPCLRSHIVAFLEYRYGRIITITLLLEDIVNMQMEISLIP